jgi:hypothetical protein
MWSAKAKSYLVMKFFGPTLLVSFQGALPENDQELLDQSKANEWAFLKCKEIDLHVMNLLNMMMVENDLMLMMMESMKSKEWPN